MHSSVIFPLLVIFLNEATAQPPLPPHQRHPGDKVVIVVQNENGHPPLPPSNMVMSESKISERKSILAPTPGLKRRGQALQKQNVEDSPQNGGGGKKEKSLLTKLLPTSSRHISGPSDMFRKNFHHAQKSPHGGLDEKPRGQQPQYGRPPPPLGSGDFRPHQPDITPDFQGGKLSLPVGFNEDSLHSLKPRPTPMANKINPYTNGVAASFPPGIDPYDGFMRYAAENLETPMGNLIDYHSLEHYYGPQHPLSPHYNPNNKDANLNHPYADNYAYNQIDVGNSPPPLPPPQQAGFRTHDDHNFPNQANQIGNYNHPNSLNQYEHGIDHFNAPSPDSAAASRPRPYDEGIGHRGPPPEHHSFNQNHNAPPFTHSSPPDGHNEPQYHGSGDDVGHVDPPNLEVFNEGPPRHPLPPDAPPHAQPPPHHHHHHHHHPGSNGPNPEHGHAPSGDGGEDGIWGILDLAEMIEKGELPGQQNNAASSSPGKGKPSSNSPPHRGRLVIPIFTRPPPPRSSSSADHPPGPNMPPPPPILLQPDVNHHEPPPIQIPHPAIGQDGPPHSGAPKHPYNSEGFDYDENPAGGLGGNFPSRPAQYSALDSQEHEAGNDYNDDYKR